MKTRCLMLMAAAALFLSTAAFAGDDNTDVRYVEHTVKWYEDIKSISRKYGVPEDVIIKVNNLQGRETKARQKLIIPLSEHDWPALDGGITEAEDKAENIPDTTDLMTPSPTDKVDFALILPFANQDSTYNGKNMDFYAGVLLAARKLGEEGIDITVDVRDFSSRFREPLDKDCAFVIGPVRSDDIAETVTVFGDSTVIISPLDQKATSLSLNHGNIIQAAAGMPNQYENLIAWAIESSSGAGEVNCIIVGSEQDSVALDSARKAFESAGIGYKLCLSGVQGDIEGWEENYLPAEEQGRNVVILAITNEAVLNNAIRNMAVFSSLGNISVYAGGKLRSYGTIPEENLHKAGVHVLCPYYVDYSSRETLDFIHRYRALFNAEPSQFSFQGYDVATYMVRTYTKYGKPWMKFLKEEPETAMLQMNLKFCEAGENGGPVNCGMRRITYNNDYTITLE